MADSHKLSTHLTTHAKTLQESFLVIPQIKHSELAKLPDLLPQWFTFIHRQRDQLTASFPLFVDRSLPMLIWSSVKLCISRFGPKICFCTESGVCRVLQMLTLKKKHELGISSNFWQLFVSWRSFSNSQLLALAHLSSRSLLSWALCPSLTARLGSLSRSSYSKCAAPFIPSLVFDVPLAGISYWDGLSGWSDCLTLRDLRAFLLWILESLRKRCLLFFSICLAWIGLWERRISFGLWTVWGLRDIVLIGCIMNILVPNKWGAQFDLADLDISVLKYAEK